MSYTNTPPLPGEAILTVPEVAALAKCSVQTAYLAAREGRLATVTVAGRICVAESEAKRYATEWPTNPTAQSWRAYRHWRDSQAPGV